jgi:hypothetical protein
MEYHRKQAKALVRAYRAGEREAVERAEAVLGGRARERFLLSDAQHVIAREQGHRSWPALAAAAGAVEERVVDSGLEYVPGEPVRVRVRKRHHRYVIDDDGRAVELAGRPRGWLEVAERAVGEYWLNVNRRGVVFVPTVYERYLDELTARVAQASRAVYQEVLEGQ